jgi:proteasome regulatory subunit
VPKPNAEGRERILEIHSQQISVDTDVDFADLAAELDDYSGADIESLITEAGMFAIRDDRTTVSRADIDDAREKLDANETDDGVVRYRH